MLMKWTAIKDIFAVEKANAFLGAIYIGLLAVSLLPYLITVVLGPEGYNPGIYRDAYLYFMVYDFIVFSLFIPFWEAGATGTGLRANFLQPLAGITIMAFSSSPLILAIFMTSRLNIINFLLPLLIKPVWGMAILSLKKFLVLLKKQGRRWGDLALALFIFLTLAGGSLLVLFSVEYRQAVITTVYDLDIPQALFLNPLLSLIGLVYSQVGGESQMGYRPFYTCVIFWGLFSAVLIGGANRIDSRRARRNGYEG